MMFEQTSFEGYLFQFSCFLGGVVVIANAAVIMHKSVVKLISSQSTMNDSYLKADTSNGPIEFTEYCETNHQNSSLRKIHSSTQFKEHIDLPNNHKNQQEAHHETFQPKYMKLTHLLLICCTLETVCTISSTVLTGANLQLATYNSTLPFYTSLTALASFKSIHIAPFLSTLALCALSTFPVLLLSTKHCFKGWVGRLECTLVVLTFVLISRCIAFVFFPHNFIQGCEYNLFIQRILLPWFVYMSMYMGVKLASNTSFTHICNNSFHPFSNFDSNHIPEKSNSSFSKSSQDNEIKRKSSNRSNKKVIYCGGVPENSDCFMPCVVLMKKQASIMHKQCLNIGTSPKPLKTRRRASLDVMKEHNMLSDGLRWQDVMDRRRYSLPPVLASSKRKAVMSSVLVDTSTLVEIQTRLEQYGKSPSEVDSLVEDLQNLLKPYKTDHVRPRQVIWLHDSATDGSDDEPVFSSRHSSGKRSSRRSEWNSGSRDMFSTTTTATGLPKEDPAPAKPKRIPKISKEKSPLVTPLDSRCSSPVIDSSRVNLGRRKTYPSLPITGSHVTFPSTQTLLSIPKKFPAISSDYESCDNDEVTAHISRSKSVNETEDPIELHQLHKVDNQPQFSSLTSQDDPSHFEDVASCHSNEWVEEGSSDDGSSFFVSYQHKLLGLVNNWNFPIFTLAQETDCVLSQMAFKLFQDTGLFETFKIPKYEFVQYMKALESGYRNIPYHNRIHAADVLHGCWYLSTQVIPGFHESSSLFSSDSSDSDSGTGTSHTHCQVNNIRHGSLAQAIPALELMSLYLAAAMHDYDHPGRTNAFLVETRHPLAILYNDRSVLENHHASSSWGLLYSDPRYDFLKNLDTAEWKRLRFLVVEAILATDLKKHFVILSQFGVKSQNGKGISWSADEDRLLVCQMVIKLADIGGPAKKRNLHMTWTKAICEEFFIQGDEERELGLPVSPFMDREQPQVAELQRTFINNLIKPIVQSMHKSGILAGKVEESEESEVVESNESLLLEQLKDNLNFWKAKQPACGHEEMNEAFKLALPVDLSIRETNPAFPTQRVNVTITDNPICRVNKPDNLSSTEGITSSQHIVSSKPMTSSQHMKSTDAMTSSQHMVSSNAMTSSDTMTSKKCRINSILEKPRIIITHGVPPPSS